MRNVLLCTDTYKTGHMQQYPEGTTKIYSYLCARSNKKYDKAVFFGLQYYLKEYLSQKITKEMVEEFLDIRQSILGPDTTGQIAEKMYALADLGYLPLEIKAVPEGTVIDNKNVLATITNTHPDFAWVVGFTESLVLKVWNTTTVATSSKRFKDLVTKFADETCGHRGLVPFQVHDFGYRGVSSEETAELSGAAHLVNFLGTDTVPAVGFARKFYNASAPIGLSVPASEHSVMCSFGQENELDAFKNMLKLYPSGLVSVVSDTYNLWNVLTNFASELKEEILARDGKFVFRPDSGDPESIICGDASAPEGSDENLGSIRLLDKMFGSTVNALGFKELNPKVGLIYGDGMYYERFERVLNRLKDMGYASSNLVIGVGGLLLQQHNRDDLGFALKATFAVVNGEERELMKDPITDSGKKSHKGMMKLIKEDGVFKTIDQVTEAEESTTLLDTVFRDGVVLKEYTFDEIRKRSEE